MKCGHSVICCYQLNKFLLKVSYQLLCHNEAKDSILNLYCTITLDDEKRCVICMACNAEVSSKGLKDNL